MSFAGEMKDFISAAQAGQKMVGAASDAEYNKVKSKYLQEQTRTIQQKNDDEEGQAADLALKQARVRNVNASTANHVQQAAAWKLANQPPGPVALPTSTSITPATTDAPAAPQAAPVQAVPANVQPGYPSPPDQAPTNLAFKNGGAVQHFADGGAVGDDEPAAPAAPAEEEPDDETADEALTTPPAVGGASDTTDISSRSRGAPSFSHAAAIDGVHAGLTYMSKALGLHQDGAVMTPGRQRAAQAWSTGAHAASPDDMAAIQKSIDPDNKLPESSRNLAAVGAVYQWKMNKGDPEGAAKAAGQMIQYYRQASQRYAVIAAAAAQKGDLDTATHAAMKAYANVPDGQNFQVQKTPDGQLSYSITDEKTGKVISKGIESPEKLASSAMGFAANGFDQSLLAAAGQRSTAGKPAVDPNTAPMKTADKKAALKGVDDAYDEQNPDDEKTKAPKYNAADKRDLKGAAFRIAAHTANSRLTPSEAMDITTKIADPSVTDEASKPQVAKTDGGYKVKIGGKQAFVPEADFDALMVKRNAKIESLKPKPAEPGFIEKASKALGDLRTSNKQALARKEFTEPNIP